MRGRSGRTRPLRLNDPLGHLVPPGQLLVPELVRSLVERFDAEHDPARPHGTPRTFTLRMHPADRAWLPPTFTRDASAILTEHADLAGFTALDGVHVQIETDPACDLGRPSVRTHTPTRTIHLDETVRPAAR